MSEWKPLTRQSSTRLHGKDGEIVLTKTGALMIPREIGIRFAPQYKAQPVAMGARIGLRPVRDSVSGWTLTLSTPTYSTFVILCAGILRAAGKRKPKQTVEIGHSWEGDVLVIDLSGLPDSEVR